MEQVFAVEQRRPAGRIAADPTTDPDIPLPRATLHSMQMRLVAMLITIGTAMSSLDAQMIVVPRAHDVIPVKGSTVLSLSADDIAHTVEKVAKSMGARLGKSPRGNTVVSIRVPTIKLDENCIYPIINGKTGGHLQTFASWQMGLLHGREEQRNARPSGDVLLELSIQPAEGGRTRFEFWSNCVADTELGRVLANSTGKFERAFLNQLAPGLNLDTWTTAA